MNAVSGEVINMTIEDSTQKSERVIPVAAIGVGHLGQHHAGARRRTGSDQGRRNQIQRCRGEDHG